MIHPIDTYSVWIEDEKDLSDVATANSPVTHVYFSKDIIMTKPIEINPNRLVLVLDGEYPIGSGATHQFFDPDDDGIAKTLCIQQASNIKITLRNFYIEGRDWFGFPAIWDSTTTSNVEVGYENVTYKGRQPMRNIHGLVRFIDSDITLQAMRLGRAGEAAECCRAEIGGVTSITKTNNADSVFYFQGNASRNQLTILADADVSISTTNYFMYANGRTVPYTIGPGARFRLTTGSGLSYAIGHDVSPFIVGENASFEYTQILPTTSVYVPGTLTLRPGASFSMGADYANANPLIYFRNSGTVRNLELNNPKRFLVYKRATPAMYFAGSWPFWFEAEQVNYWRTATAFPDAGTFADPPQYTWHNKDWSSFQISGNARTSSMSGVTSTLANPDSPALSLLTLYNAGVLSVGNLPLEVETPVDNNRPIKGTTDPFANLKLEYTDAGGAHTITANADADGKFSIQTPGPVPAGTLIRVHANVPFLYKTLELPVQAAGSLYIESAPKFITFVVPPISPKPLNILGRKPTGDDSVVVYDDRVHKTPWTLKATVDGPMHDPDGEPCLSLIVFVQERSAYASRKPFVAGDEMPILTTTSAGIRTHCEWDDDDGILLDVTGPLRLNVEYTATVIWSVYPNE